MTSAATQLVFSASTGPSPAVPSSTPTNANSGLGGTLTLPIGLDAQLGNELDAGPANP